MLGPFGVRLRKAIARLQRGSLLALLSDQTTTELVFSDEVTTRALLDDTPTVAALPSDAVTTRALLDDTPTAAILLDD
jgi:hypothetical protein